MKEWRNEELFWSKVDKTDIVSCWLWKAARDPNGYGRFWHKKRMCLSHRISWEFINGDPGKMHVLHKCDNPPCVNPNHLFLGTQVDNNKDRDSKGRLKPGWAGGEINGMSKLKSADVVEIRRRLSNGESKRQLGRDFGINRRTIRDIETGRTWKHV